MTVWYINPETGTDANCSAGNGDSIATARKSLTNMVAAAIAGGDHIKFLKSPAPVPLGVNGTWTSDVPKATVNITSSTNATPIVLTLPTGHGFADNDIVLIGNHATNTNANGVWKLASVDATSATLLNQDGSNSVGNGAGGATGTVIDITRSAVILASAVTKNIALNGNRGTKTNWTASANVTNTVTTSVNKEGGECQQIAIAAGFTTGKAAYLALSGSTDYSSYQKVSFWIRQSAGTLATAGQIQIKLCSDTAGNTAVDTLDIPAVGMLNVWQPVTIDKGSALGSAIQSVAIYVVTDSGAQTFQIDNIFACNDLHLKTAIGKASGNYLFPQSVNLTRVILDANPDTCQPTVNAYSPGYYGTSETVAAYVQKMYSYGAGTNTSVVTQSILDSGSAGSPITISGGWDATFTTQDGITWLDGENGRNYGIQIATKSYLDISDKTIALCRYYRGVDSVTLNNSNIQFYAVNQCASVGLYANGWCSETILGATYVENCVTNISGLQGGRFIVTECNNSTSGNITVSAGGIYQVVNSCNSKASGILANGVTQLTLCQIENIKNNFVSGIDITNSDMTINGGVFSGNLTSDIKLTTMATGKLVLLNATASSSTLISGQANSQSSWGAVCFLGFNGDPFDTRIYNNNGTILSDSSIKYSALSKHSFKLSPNSTTYVVSSSALPLMLGRVKLKAGNNEISVQTRRDDTGITGRLIIYGGGAPGIASDVSDESTAAADTWEKLTLSVSPTSDCEVEVWFEAYGGTTYSAYVDDLQVKRGSFSGNITETMAITDWVIRAINAVDDTVAGYAESSGATYSINVNTDDDCWLKIAPKIHTRWEASRVNSLDEYGVAVDTDTTPYLFKCTTAGTSHATTEPSWNVTISGTTTDNTTTWTCISILPDAASLLIGPKKPTVL